MPYCKLCIIYFEICPRNDVVESQLKLSLCGTEGEWENYPSNSSCERIKCARPPVIDQGKSLPISEKDHKYGDMVNYTCNDGHQFSSDIKAIICKVSGMFFLSNSFLISAYTTLIYSWVWILLVLFNLLIGYALSRVISVPLLITLSRIQTIKLFSLAASTFEYFQRCNLFIFLLLRLTNLGAFHQFAHQSIVALL